MKSVGLLGGMSWVSTQHYYGEINRQVADAVGGDACAPLIVWQTDFARITALQRAGRWDDAATVLAEGALALRAAGAQQLAICANTMHLVAPAIEAAVPDLPIIHIVTEVSVVARQRALTCLGVLGTQYTMESAELYPPTLARHGISMVVPNAADRDAIQAHTFNELIRDVVTDDARATFRRASRDMIERGADAVLLACTEHQMVLADGDLPVPVLDSTAIHCNAIVRAILA